jgi:hypothetical protein
MACSVEVTDLHAQMLRAWCKREPGLVQRDATQSGV